MFRYLSLSLLLLVSTMLIGQEIATSETISIAGHDREIGFLVSCQFAEKHCSVSKAVPVGDEIVVLNDDALLVTEWTGHHLQAATKSGSWSGAVFLNDHSIAIDMDTKSVTETMCGRNMSPVVGTLVPQYPYSPGCYQTKWEHGHAKAHS